MKNKFDINKLSQLVKPDFSFSELLDEIQLIKEEYVNENNQGEAKKLWCFQTIVSIHKDYNNAFNLLVQKKYYEAWCQLEKIEITFHSLKQHLQFNNNEYLLNFIEKTVRNLQIIYPYKLFGSSEIVKKKAKCGICGKPISIRTNCGHEVGEIYDGEMCYRIITEADVLGLALVENPENKYSVLFTKDSKTGKQIDQYNYNALDYLFEHIKSPYELWELKVTQKLKSHDHYKDIGRNDKCPCNSKLKYKNCCLKNEGVKYLHYEFLVENLPVNEKITKEKINASR